MKVYITTKSPLDGPYEDVIRFQHDDYAEEDYAILTLAGFTKVLELAQGWATENLETLFYDDVDALIADYCREHSPTRLKIMASEEAKRATREKFEQWISEDIAAEPSTIAESEESTVAAKKAAAEEYLEREYEKKRKERHYSKKEEKERRNDISSNDQQI